MKTSRRGFLRLGCAVALSSKVSLSKPIDDTGLVVNDIHSQLNRTVVDSIISPRSISDIQSAIANAKSRRRPISIAGGRHAMGTQQFGTDAVLLDMREMNRVLSLDRERGLVEAESGILWPKLIGYLNEAQAGQDKQWGIIQKQTGADRLSLGGALAANVHGRGLNLKPIIDNVESFTLIDAQGGLKKCSRQENSELFRLAIGGYGLFGVVLSVQLRLRPRVKVQRVVEIRETRDIPAMFDQRIKDGYLYGDFQYATDSNRESFMRRGVFSCYRPVDPATPLTINPTRFHPEDWAKLTYYTHKYKRRAFEVYTKRYLETSGQIYWADSQLSGAYVDNYHEDLDRKIGARVKGTEMITEIYIPRNSLVNFMEAAREELKRQKANVIYGTVRLIEKDTESFLAWARESWACVIFNLHIDHEPQKIAAAATAFRSLIDIAVNFDGSYYLTYHRWATRDQVEKCYPPFREFLKLKQKYDPEELFQSDWYRHHKRMFT
ncbi:MAG TPA: FAD-binding oxidoreductase [Blastocatellia bacterium]|nr:FAD-binding oxidoreductase [Blastocatellia bacterium]